MNIKEAYKILGIAENSSKEDIKKAYKSLVVKYHPDKEGGSEEKMKEINEAHNFLQNPPPEPSFDFDNIGSVDFGGFPFSAIFNQQQHKRHHFSPPSLEISISFKDAITGCDRQVSFNRYIKCTKCNGDGFIKLDNGCKSCGGKGKTTVQRGGTVFVQTCTKCAGQFKKNACAECDSTGVKEEKISGEISIPAGSPNGARLTLRGMGNYSGNSMFGEAYSDAYVFLQVQAEENMKMDGLDVVSNLDISLLEALTGVNKQIKTIYGDKKIEIKPLTKNKDIFEIDGCGVKNSMGKHKVIINVLYPDDPQKIIEIMRGN